MDKHSWAAFCRGQHLPHPLGAAPGLSARRDSNRRRVRYSITQPSLPENTQNLNFGRSELTEIIPEILKSESVQVILVTRTNLITGKLHCFFGFVWCVKDWQQLEHVSTVSQRCTE